MTVAEFRTVQCRKCLKVFDICRRCDRNRVYCSQGCRQSSRHRTLEHSHRRYRQSLPGRKRRAEQSKRYRQKNEGDQGSDRSCNNVTICASKEETSCYEESKHEPCPRPTVTTKAAPDKRVCNFCGKSTDFPHLYRFTYLTRKSRYRLRL